MVTRRGCQKEVQGRDEGIIVVIVALSLVLLVAVAALAIDMGRLYSGRNELQNAADGAALAACRKLGAVHKSGGVVDENEIRAVAIDIASQNAAAGESVSISNESIEVGCWNSEDTSFDVNCNNNVWWASPSAGIKKNAVRVVAARTGENSITTFFAKVIGIDKVSVSADAIAALSGLSQIDEGEMIPVGISDYWYHYPWPGGFCDQNIKFFPTNNIEGCAGWHSFDNPNTTPNFLWGLFDGMISNTSPSPGANTEDTVYPTGGTVQSALCHPNKTDFEDLFNAKKDPITGKWKTSVVVYESGDCSNPTGDMRILGFSTAIIEGINCDTKEIVAQVICDEYKDARGGGGMYGTFGTIPGLVE